MDFITHSQPEKAAHSTIGGKAKNLFRLKALGLPVPEWVVIPQEELAKLVPEAIQKGEPEKIQVFIQSLTLPLVFLEQIIQQFPPDTFFAVRSSALDEDGADFSFAGQFESHLYVTPARLEEIIKKVWCSAFTARVYEYRRNNKLKPLFGIAVIIQVLVNADVAGVAFGMNPATGDRRSKIISAVYGLGEGLVSGELNSDNYSFKDNRVIPDIADKTHRFIPLPGTAGGIHKVEVDAAMRKLPCLNDEQVRALAAILDQCREIYGRPQDMEFAISQHKIFLLQSRPITNLHKIADPGGEYILWDNSNIIESYPGVTTPLTFSFISKSYEGAYRLFCGFMGVSEKVIRENERVFANTLGLINGHVFYNLKTWYHMLALLPGYSINARFMEKMMGVKERFDIPDTYRLSKGAAWRSILLMGFRMYGRYLSLPSRRRAFMALVNKTITEYKQIKYEEKDACELMHLYLRFETLLLNEWKAPLLNDFFAMIWFGRLQKRCEKYGLHKNPNIHNDLLCGSSDIISVEPIHRSIALAASIAQQPELSSFFLQHDEDAIWNKLRSEPAFAVVYEEIRTYIADFGERCIGELKLETISYTQDPPRFIRVLKAYVESGITLNPAARKTEEELRARAEAQVNDALKYKPFRRWKFYKALNQTRNLVSSRENLRYERTRAFGIVRELFCQIGKKFYSEGILTEARDIFYLTKEEIFAYIEGTSVNQDLQKLVALRKAEFLAYSQMPAPSERFASYGPVYHANDFFSTARLEKIEGDLKGIGCCPGRVRGTVRVVLNPTEISSLNGDILVTSSTDPGWVILFPSALAIIVERGSLLSHSAIVSREMGKPCIVSVTGLLKRLKTGDEIEMDGSTGEIKIITPAL